MADIVSPDKRSLMMAGIKGKNTKPEIVIRLALHKAGFRYRIHGKKLPGKPDMVFPKHKAVIFVNGCFWHGHDCHLFKMPSSRVEFWQTKIFRNKENDIRANAGLREAGWRIATIWECAIKGKTRIPLASIIEQCSRWLLSVDPSIEIKGCI